MKAYDDLWLLCGMYQHNSLLYLSKFFKSIQDIFWNWPCSHTKCCVSFSLLLLPLLQTSDISLGDKAQRVHPHLKNMLKSCFGVFFSFSPHHADSWLTWWEFLSPPCLILSSLGWRTQKQKGGPSPTFGRPRPLFLRPGTELRLLQEILELGLRSLPQGLSHTFSLHLLSKEFVVAPWSTCNTSLLRMNCFETSWLTNQM